MTDALLPKRFLFHFSAPCLYAGKPWSSKGAGLSDAHRLPHLGELEDLLPWAEVWAGWNASGLAFRAQVRGKKQPPWCRPTRAEDSDGLRLWIDTRDVHNVHRASRFCHYFLFLPQGAGPRLDRPVAQWMPINRARQHPLAIAPGSLQVVADRHADGYRLDVFVPAKALTGFDPQEHPRLGFTYAVLDRELGEQTFTVGSPMPYQEDPSLWATLELTR
jgi:hypothetical protein